MSRLTPTRRAVLGLGLLTLVLVPVAVWTLLTGVTPYDDEGLMLLTLGALSSHGAPYTDFVSQYGPFWLELLGGPFALVGRPPTHDAGRLVVAGLWLASAALVGLAVQLLTARLVLALVSLLCAFTALEALAVEPMHPSSVAALLVAAAAVAPLVLQRRPQAALAALGGIVAALALTKVNIGGLLLIAVLYGLAISHRRTGRRPGLAAAAALVVLPVVLLGPDLGSRDRLVECAVAVAAALAVVVAGAGNDRLRVVAVPYPLAWLGAGVLAVALPVLAIPLLLGTTPADLIDGVLIAPARQPGAFSVALALPAWTVLWALAALGLAAAVRLRGAPPRAAAVGRLLAGGAILLAVFSYLPMTNGRIIGFVIPLAWVAAVPPSTPLAPGAALARACLPAAAVTGALQAYPVAGTQVWVGLLPSIVVGAVCLADGIAQLRGIPSRPHPSLATTGRALGALAGIVLLVLAAITEGRRAAEARDRYAGWPSLRLPGAASVRAAPADVETLQAVVRHLRRRCSALITLPGMHSFDLWSGVSAPTADNTTHWWSLLSSGQQREAVARARATPAPCVLRNDALVAFWARPSPPRSSRSPLMRFIEQDFAPTVRVGPYQLLERRAA